MNRAQITLICPKCDSQETTNRLRADPPRAVNISMICPDCDDGDFYAPTYYDSGGNEIPFDEDPDRMREDRDERQRLAREDGE